MIGCEKTVVPHDPSWKERFTSESVRVRSALGDTAVAIHHIGSTSIPGILAKPIIDILVEARQLGAVDGCTAKMTDLNYEAMGEYGIAGRRYFRKRNADGVRTYHIHVFEQGSDHLLRHIAFRDFLLAYPQKAHDYSDLKATIIDSGVTAWSDYADAKESFIKATESDAIAWFRNQR